MRQHMDLGTAIYSAKTHSQLMNSISGSLWTRAVNSLSMPEHAWLRSAGGKEAGSFLEGPPGPEYDLADNRWPTACRLGLGMHNFSK